jgi:hypothetical protein
LMASIKLGMISLISLSPGSSRWNWNECLGPQRQRHAPRVGIAESGRLSHLLHTFTPTPAPVDPHGITPSSRAIRCRNGTASDVAIGEGEPNMIVRVPALAATIPAKLSGLVRPMLRGGHGQTATGVLEPAVWFAGLPRPGSQSPRPDSPPETGASIINALPPVSSWIRFATSIATVGSSVVPSTRSVLGCAEGAAVSV